MVDSCIGCTGAVYAIRRSLFQELPSDTLLDDVVVPMQILLAGYRVVFNAAAQAYDPQPLEPLMERVRKRRTIAGNFQMLFRYPGWMLPGKNRLWWQLISHKYLRLISPLFLGVCLGSCLLLRDGIFYRIILSGQVLFYAASLFGSFGFIKKHRVLGYPASFVFLNWMVLEGLWSYLSGKNNGTWEGKRPPLERT